MALKCLIFVCFFDLIHCILRFNTSHYKEKPSVSKFCSALLKFVSKLQPQQDHSSDTIKKVCGGEEGETDTNGGGNRSGGHCLQAQQTVDVSPSS